MKKTKTDKKTKTEKQKNTDVVDFSAFKKEKAEKKEEEEELSEDELDEILRDQNTTQLFDALLDMVDEFNKDGINVSRFVDVLEALQLNSKAGDFDEVDAEQFESLTNLCARMKVIKKKCPDMYNLFKDPTTLLEISVLFLSIISSPFVITREEDS